MKTQWIVLASSLFPVVLCFSDTVPLVAWSSSILPTLDHLPASRASDTWSLLESILLDDASCDHDAIILIEQPGLHASDLRALPPTSGLAQILQSSPSSRQFPYLLYASPSSDVFDEVAAFVSTKCKSQLVSITPEYDTSGFVPGKKYIFRIAFPPLRGDAEDRGRLMMDHDSRLSTAILSATTALPKHLVILAGSPALVQTNKRQSASSSVFAVPPSGGILHRYQLFTPALITCLLITIFVLVPVLFFGISALANIQSPFGVEAPRNYNAQERKNQ